MYCNVRACSFRVISQPLSTLLPSNFVQTSKIQVAYVTNNEQQFKYYTAVLI